MSLETNFEMTQVVGDGRMMSGEAASMHVHLQQQRMWTGRPGLKGKAGPELETTRVELCQRVGNVTRAPPAIGQLFKSEPRSCKSLRGTRLTVMALDGAEAVPQPTMMGMLRGGGAAGAAPLEDEVVDVAVELTDSRLLISSLFAAPTGQETDFVTKEEVQASPMPQARCVTTLQTGYMSQFKMMNIPRNHIFTVQCGRCQGAVATTIASLHTQWWIIVLLVLLGLVLFGAMTGVGFKEREPDSMYGSENNGALFGFVAGGFGLCLIFSGLAFLVYTTGCCLSYQAEEQPANMMDVTKLVVSAVDPCRQRAVLISIEISPPVGSPEGTEVLPDVLDFVEASSGEAVTTHVAVHPLGPVRRKAHGSAGDVVC
eukprot:TRINITY_DN295_c0_g1_i2.p2 TRINITY_DN295_c0_g1~~TRINITY_DN295_c0_g1_i2.p2  ORF type:complete len:371 (+),score=122.99 TRINITY_DN295_c0_g1_i2:105-1217(+)